MFLGVAVGRRWLGATLHAWTANRPDVESTWRSLRRRFNYGRATAITATQRFTTKAARCSCCRRLTLARRKPVMESATDHGEGISDNN